jgi:uncharacterized iron-regulated membrane protein
MSRRLFFAHRWLGALVGAQLLFWCLGGFIFATHDIEWVRGKATAVDAAAIAVDWSLVKLTPAQAAQAAREADRQADEVVESVSLKAFLGKPVFEVVRESGSTLVAADDGRVLTPLTSQAAVAVARADQIGKPSSLSVTFVTENPETEYRGKPLPAWRIDLDDADNTHVYVSALNGSITARRNDAWRRFDFFWMLHTMDYGGRDNFNTALLVGFAAAGLLSVLSGWVLWAGRLRRWMRNRRRRREQETKASPAAARG